MSKCEKLVLVYSERGIDFMASTVAFMESQKKKLDISIIDEKTPDKSKDFFKQRLAHY